MWFFYALGASAMWGMGYLFSEKILKAGIAAPFLSLVYVLSAMPVYLLICHFTNSLKPGVEILSANKTVILYFAIMTASFVAGTYLVFTSISWKNATLVNLVEISYPVFTVLFSWLIFKEFHLNMASLFGAILIFSGIALIYLKS